MIFNNINFKNSESLEEYIKENNNDDYLRLKKEDISVEQYAFNIRNKKDPFTKFGKSIISGKPTTWNNSLNKYNRILDEEKEEYRKLFSERMKKIHNTDNLLVLPEQQRKMLANRSISGKYKYSDGIEFTYTGSYEHHFLVFMDTMVNWNSEDIYLPAPFEIKYINPKTNKESFFIPDVFIESCNLVLEIKASDNNHYRQRDIDIEFAKDAAMKGTNYSYLKVFDKDYSELLTILNNKKTNY
jgi:hypothetical protein